MNCTNPMSQAVNSPAWAALIRILHQNDQLQQAVRKFLAHHKPGCRCRLCQWIETQGTISGQAGLLRDLQGLLWSLEQAWAGIQGCMPGGTES